MGVINEEFYVDCVKDIRDDLKHRNGIGDEWAKIDKETQIQILKTWASLIRRQLINRH